MGRYPGSSGALADPPVDAAEGLGSLIESLRGHRRLGRELVHHAHLPASAPSWGGLDPPLPQPLAAALAGSGVRRLWRHQTEAIAAARAGEDVLVTTPTASGKSLVFQVPVLEEALRGGDGRALFLFPLKALGQDQKGKLDRLAAACGLGGDLPSFSAIYDGDTPRTDRARIKRDPPRVLITNPDMLHLAVLGYHDGWRHLLGSLRWIVLDELHTYRGIFGSHFHHVLQRLLRLCRDAGGNPALIASSATAANAGEFARALTGRRFRWIAESGAPREGRHLLLFRPEASPYTTALALFTGLLRAGLKTIVFTKARRITELLYSWLRRQEPELARRVASYRAGFLPEERRRIEADLFAGRLDGVISTSALEMGIDVGGLDACVLVGFPGSIMATWQRSGRVGRDGRDSLTALVALPDALDQYFLDHPAELLGRPCEKLVVDPANRPVARAHLVCAAAERPLRPRAAEAEGGDAGYLAPHGGLVGEMVAAGELLESVAGDELCSLRRHPERGIGLRGIGATYRIVHRRGDRERTIGTVDGVRAFHECHPGAVYLHFGSQHLVTELDVEDRRALAEPADLDYFTNPLTEKETEILEVLEERRDGPLAAWLGRVRVTERVVGFERKRIQGQEVIDRKPLELPPTEYETVALWWAAPPAIEETLRGAGQHFMGALHAAEHAAISLFPLLALCDRGDIGGVSMPFHPQVGCGAVFVYDGHPGGVGIAAAGFERLPELLGRVHDLVAGCECEDGCPSCVQSPKCGNGNRPLDKAGAARVARLLLGRERPVREPEPVTLALDAVKPRTETAEAPRVYRMEEATEEAPAPAPAGTGGAGGPRGGGRSAGGRSWPEGSGRGIPRPPPGVAVAPPVHAAAEQLAAFELSSGPVALSMSLPMAFSDLPPPPTNGGPAAEPVLRPRPLAPPPWLSEAAPPSPAAVAAPERLPDTVLFDVETKRGAADVGGWGNIHRMGLAVAVACHLEEGRFEVFREPDAARLAEVLAAATLVVGFNVKRFDYRVLAGYTGVDYARYLPTFDLLEELHRALGVRVGLNALAQATLGTGKSADGLQSLEWVRQGRLDLVEEYCRKDVEVLRDLYLHGRREGCVHLTDKRRGTAVRLRVEW